MAISIEPLLTATELPHHQPDAPLVADEAPALEPALVEGLLMVKRWSVQLAVRPPDSAHPVTRTRDVKIKKLGLPTEDMDTKAVKKCQLLQAYTDADGDAAEAAVQDLLGIQAQAA
jgi:hypothetical protein